VPTLTSTQQSYVALIFREFAAAGWKPAVAAAAAVNAYAESGLNPLAIGDGGKSVGLFQLHEKGGGAGMTTAQRQDPTLNTRRIIEEANKAMGFRIVAAASDDIPTLAAAFSTYVERPKDKPTEEIKRSTLARVLFPYGAGVLSPDGQPTMPMLQYPPKPPEADRSTYWWFALATVAIGSLLIAYRFRGASDAP
jgi:hypothetical protein